MGRCGLTKEQNRKRQDKLIELVADGGKSLKQCAIEAGYSEKTANSAIARLIKNNDYIRESIKQRKLEKKIHTSPIASEQEVLETITAIMRSKKSIPRDVLKAAETLGKKYNMWDDKNQNNINVTVAPKVIVDV